MILGRVGVVKVGLVKDAVALDEFGLDAYTVVTRDLGVWTRARLVPGATPPQPGAQVLLVIPDEARAQPWILGALPPNVGRELTDAQPTAPGQDSAAQRSVLDFVLGAHQGGQVAVLGRGGPLVRASSGEAVKIEVEGGGFVRLAQRGAGDGERAALGRAVQAHLEAQRAQIVRLQELVTALQLAVTGSAPVPPLEPPPEVGGEVLSALLHLSSVSE